jgi:MFS family permease
MRPNREQPADRRWVIVALLCAAQFMLILDITVVNVALPSIQADVGVAPGDLQWVVTAYTLVFGGLVLLGGRAADLFGRRRVFLSGVVVFTGASLVSALAGSTGVLVGARAARRCSRPVPPGTGRSAPGLLSRPAAAQSVSWPAVSSPSRWAGGRSSTSTCRSGSWRPSPRGGSSRPSARPAVAGST